jgi:hypothetical protein
MSPIGVSVVALMVGASVAAQVVLRDVPTRVAAQEQPRWLGRTSIASAPDRRVLVDRSLRCIEASSVEFGADQVRYRDVNGRVATLPTSMLAMVLPPEPVQEGGAGSIKGIEWREIADVATGPQGRLELVDGQVIPGRLVEGKATADAIAWEHWLLGPVDVPIERIARVVFRTDGIIAGTKADGTNDVVSFVNGDVARGVVESVAWTAQAGELSMDVKGKPFVTPLERVAAVAFANPAQGRRGVAVWLRDGTVVGSESADVGARCITLTGANIGVDTPIEIAWDEVVGVNMDAGAVVPFSRLTLAGVEAGEGRTWCVAPRIESAELAPGAVGEIELSGPIKARWMLPPGVLSISMSASLPPAARTLGDCVLVVECGGQIVRQRLTGEKPTAEIRLNLSSEADAGFVSITIESGEGGSIQDRVVLRRALALVR